MARNKGLLPFSGNFEPQVAGPFDARTVVGTVAELVLAATWTAKDGNFYSPVGLQVLVNNDTEANNGTYFLPVGKDYTLAGDWVKGNGSGGTGTGDMLKSTYDTNNNGKVDTAENAEKLGGTSADQFVQTTDPRLSDARPASDVSAWAKASLKPEYTAGEVGAQEALTSGQNIKTINGESILGTGNITVEGGPVDADSVDAAIQTYTAATSVSDSTKFPLFSKAYATFLQLRTFLADYFAAKNHNHDSAYDAAGTAAGLVASEASTRSNADNAISQAVTDLTTLVTQINNWKTSLTDADQDSIVNTLTELLATFNNVPEGTDIYGIITAKLGKSDVVNTLTSILTDVPLSAAQGTALKGLIDGLTTALSGKEDSSNKTTDFASNTASDIKFPSVKAIYTWIVNFFTPKSRSISINGTAQDLSADRSWTITPGGAGSDTTAIHKDTDNEYSTITEKTTFADADVFLMEDSAEGFAKKKWTFSNFFSYFVNTKTVSTLNTTSKILTGAINEVRAGGINASAVDVSTWALGEERPIGARKNATTGAAEFAPNIGVIDVYALSTAYKTYLTTEANWLDVNGRPVATIITGWGLQCQRYTTVDYVYECIEDNKWTRYPLVATLDIYNVPAAAITAITTAGNWTGVNYTGAALTGCWKGMRYVSAAYVYEFYDDNIPCRYARI